VHRKHRPFGVLAESILRKDGRRHFAVFRRQPAEGTVNPFAITV